MAARDLRSRDLGVKGFERIPSRIAFHHYRGRLKVTFAEMRCNYRRVQEIDASGTRRGGVQRIPCYSFQLALCSNEVNTSRVESMPRT